MLDVLSVGFLGRRCQVNCGSNAGAEELRDSLKALRASLLDYPEAFPRIAMYSLALNIWADGATCRVEPAINIKRNILEICNADTHPTTTPRGYVSRAGRLDSP